MPSGRAVRHAALLALFLVLLSLGVLREGVFDDAENSHGGEAREQRDEQHSLFTLLFTSPAQWRATPLTLDRREFPHATDAFVAEHVNRSTPPQLRDVMDARTLTAFDFFEQLQLWRLAGRAGARVAELTDAQLTQERAAARAEALRNRGRKSWTTRRGEGDGGSVLRLFGVGSSGAADDLDEEASGVVEAHYPADSVLHCSGCNTTGTTFSLMTSDVELVPYPWVPSPQPPRSSRTTSETGAAVKASADNSTHTTVRIRKGKVRLAVPHRAGPHTPSHGWDHFYIALNLWKNEEVLPDLTEALIVFLEEEVKPFFDLATSVVIAIYANVSPDRTAELIDTLLIPRLHAVGVRAVYATTEGACLGYVERQPFHERIEWMACIRNKALAPLYELGMQAFPQGQRPPGGPTVRRSPAAAHVDNGDSDGRDGLVVIFFNDIFFRPQDITTLLESRAEPRMAAAVQPHGWRSTTTPSGADETEVRGAHRRAADTAAMPSITTTTTTRMGTTFDMACGMDFYFTFYDTWVTRDRLGQPFAAQMPYSDDHATQDAFYRILKHERSGDTGAGEPKLETTAIPIKCCWNGVAAIRGRFFLPPTPAHRARFPASLAAEGEQATAAVLVEGRSAGNGASPLDVAARVAALTIHNGTVPVGSASTNESGLPAALRRPSGTAYDRVGSVQAVLQHTGLQRYYLRVLARRLQSECAAWTSTRREIAEVTGVPFYAPERCANSSSFEAMLAAVVAGMQEDGQAVWTRLRLQPSPATSPSPVAGVEKDKGEGEEEDGVYYRARHPSLRFRHAFTPSYGAAVHGQRPVRDDVCLSSECLLICQDVMQAALVQDGRAPVLLLNPHVRVAYDLDHFARVTQHTWFFENPYVYWGWTVARRAQLWWAAFSPLARLPWRRADSGEADGLRELGKATSALDDWLAEPDTAATQTTHATITVRDGAGRVTARGTVDVPTLTRMDCQRITAGSIELAMGGLFPLARLAQLLAVALLVRWWCWQAQADVTAAAAAGRGGGGAVEQRWWRAVYHAVWHSWAAQRVRRGLDAITDAPRQSRFSEVYGSGGDGDAEGGGGATYDEADVMADGSHVLDSSGTYPARGTARGRLPPTLLQLAHRLHRDNSPRLLHMMRSSSLWIGNGSRVFVLARRVGGTVAHAVVWLLASLCCVRFWCGCRPPRQPFPSFPLKSLPSALQPLRGLRRSPSPPSTRDLVADGFGYAASPLGSSVAEGKAAPFAATGHASSRWAGRRSPVPATGAAIVLPHVSSSGGVFRERVGSHGTGGAPSPAVTTTTTTTAAAIAAAGAESPTSMPVPWRAESSVYGSPTSAMQQQVRPRNVGVPGNSGSTSGSGGRTSFSFATPSVAHAGPYMTCSPATPSSLVLPRH